MKCKPSKLPEIKTDARLEKIAGSGIDLTPQQVAIVKNTVAKNTTDLELAYFLNVCNSVDLNPFLKEIWCYKDHKGNVLVFTGRDGFLARAQKSPAFAGIRSSEICEKDEFEIDIANNQIHHKIIGMGTERGTIKGAYAIVFRKDGEPTIELADFRQYSKNQAVWKTHPAEMIKKVAECHALKKAFGLSGVQVEDDFQIQNGMAAPRRLSGGRSLIEEVRYMRDGIVSDVSDEDFLKAVCKQELGKGMASTPGEKSKIKTALMGDKYDLTTGQPAQQEPEPQPAGNEDVPEYTEPKKQPDPMDNFTLEGIRKRQKNK